MAHYDLPLGELREYLPPREEPADFDAFWARSLAEARQHPIAPQFEPVEYGLQTVAAFDLTFAGCAGQPVKGWFLLPRVRHEPLPCVVEYVGYPGGRSLPFAWLLWSSQGYAHLVMDNRGQGSGWRPANTPDLPPGPLAPQIGGFVTRGIEAAETYYYRRLIVDAVRAVEAARAHPAVDPERVAVTGRSQGGGLALAVAGLDGEVAAALCNVPFLCHFRRATEITDAEPYSEIVAYCRCYRQRTEAVFRTLSYFDGINFAARARAPALFSVGLMDETCPPSTVFAAYNHYAGPKRIAVYPFNAHEGGELHHTHEEILFLQALWVQPASLSRGESLGGPDA